MKCKVQFALDFEMRYFLCVLRLAWGGDQIACAKCIICFKLPSQDLPKAYLYLLNNKAIFIARNPSNKLLHDRFHPSVQLSI